MALQLKQYIELHGDNPLDAVITGTRKKVYLVASLALNDGAEFAAEEDELTLAEVYAALAFYYENVNVIQQALEDARKQIRSLGGRDSREAREEIIRRQQK
jgi:uncharacterized protein (DUF433 family)